VVRKRRLLYLVGRTRIHLDEVEGLGAFLELEVVLADGEEEAEGEVIARRLLADLGVRDEDRVAKAYIDLLEEESGQ
jgi:predicted adenylyl cyclase CyaB